MTAVPFDTVIEHSRVTRISTPASQHKQCPTCSSTNIQTFGSMSTLLGGGDGTPDGNPNHVEESCRCRDCKLDFQRHYMRGNVWYLAKGSNVLLAGVATCFEQFYYPCKCGGVIDRKYTQTDGLTPATSLGWSNGVKLHRTFWACNGCGFNVETEEEYAKETR